MDVPHLSIEPHLNLHRRVLDRALVDMFSANPEIKNEVEEWLNLDNPDFIEACDRAYLEPESVYHCFKIIKKLIRGKNARFAGFNSKNQGNS